MAIDDILDEHEQSERVLEWLRRNGAGLFGGVLLGLAAIGGWKFWEQRQQQQQFELADRYQAALDAIEAGEPKAATTVEALGTGLHATLARLQLAAEEVRAGQHDAAIATLQAIDAAEPAIAAIVDQRLARLLVATGKPDAALTLLADSASPAALEILGDAHFALGARDAARASYARALAQLDVASPQRRLLELKLTEVGGTPTTTEATS